MTAKEKPHKEFKSEENTLTRKDRFLVLHNDDYHTFEYVINALIDICNHDTLQAEQCTILIHYKGKCDVKKGSFSYLRPMKNALVQKDLKATID